MGDAPSQSDRIATCTSRAISKPPTLATGDGRRTPGGAAPAAVPAPRSAQLATHAHRGHASVLYRSRDCTLTRVRVGNGFQHVRIARHSITLPYRPSCEGAMLPPSRPAHRPLDSSELPPLSLSSRHLHLPTYTLPPLTKCTRLLSCLRRERCQMRKQFQRHENALKPHANAMSHVVDQASIP